MKNNLMFVAGLLKKHYLLIMQIILFLFFLSFFLQSIFYKNAEHGYKTYDFKDGSATVVYPTFLLRDSDNSLIHIVYLCTTSYLETASLDIKIAIKPEGTSIESTSEVNFFNIKCFDGESLPVQFRDFGESSNYGWLHLEISVNGDIIQTDNIKIKIESKENYNLRQLSPYALIFLFFSLTITILYPKYIIRRSEADSNLTKKLEMAELRVNENQDKVKPIWDVARFTLEKYINRNQQQINLIFSLSLVVMLVSFILIVIGICIAIWSPMSLSTAILTTGVGVITEFIGATFLIVFKSTLKQASDYSKTLERIATVGVAVQILDTLIDDSQNGNIKSNTKAEVVKLLIKNTFNAINNSDENIKK